MLIKEKSGDQVALVLFSQKENRGKKHNYKFYIF
jgi:hypothetical protein